jgi:uncharacterized protein YggE
MRLVIAMTIALALGACSQEADPRGVGRDEVLLQVTASGRTDTKPDEARFTAGVETIAATAGEASTRNAQVIEKVIASVERLGVKPDDVQTRAITLNRIDYGPNRGRFQANNMIEVRVRDLKRAGEAIAATTQAGANVLSGPNLTVSDPEAASRSAYAQAYRAARARAEAYARAAGLKVARVLAIRDGGDGGGPPQIEAMAADAASAPPPVVRTAAPMRVGMTTSYVSIRADFALAR